MRPLEVPETWRTVLGPVLASPAVRRLEEWLRAEEDAGKTIFPPRQWRMRALELTPPDAVKVVILGQDPYHREGQAMGLAFSVADGVAPPPSLTNIFKELRSDLGAELPVRGNLSKWAEQGVLMLNTALTVEAGMAGSHLGRGWEALTDACLAAVAERADPCVFILWGAHAQTTMARIGASQDRRHCLIRSPHPSPLSAYRGFFGSRPFSRANAFLSTHGQPPIEWDLSQ